MRGLHSPESLRVRGRARSIRDVLGRLLQQPAYSQRMKNALLLRAWREAVGPEVASHAQVTSLRGGVLCIEVDSAPWLHELAGFHKEQMLREMRKRVRTPHIRELMFKQRGGTPQGR